MQDRLYFLATGAMWQGLGLVAYGTLIIEAGSDTPAREIGTGGAASPQGWNIGELRSVSAAFSYFFSMEIPPLSTLISTRVVFCRS